MLTELRVRNIAVIEDVTLAMGPGLNALTGETGAGKSMLVDALALLLGERASSDSIRPGAERAVVEAAFDVRNVPGLVELAEGVGIDIEDDRLVIRRDINVEGRNRAWANGSPTTVAALAAIGRRLVDLHGQHESQSLLHAASQRAMLDAFADAGRELRRTKIAFDQVIELRAQEQELSDRREDVRKRADYLRHVAREIADANPRVGEYEELDIEARRLSNVEDLTRMAERLSGLLEEDDGSVLNQLGQAGKILQQLERVDETTAEWRELFDTAEANLSELARAITTYAGEIDLDPDRLAQVEMRRSVLFKLKQKYGPDLADVIQAGEQAVAELNLLDTADLDLQKITERRARAESELESAASALSERRAQAASRIASAVTELLPGLGMPHGELTIGLEPAKNVTATGQDVVTFLVRLNPGMEPRPLSQVASGGELSRLMLALKVVLARHDAVPTLVFDEVDQGIGGETAVTVSRALTQLAGAKQVLIITHLPQIAARSARHLRIDKQTAGDVPTTTVAVLSDDERIEEIARMLGEGHDPVATRHAREMLRKGGSATRPEPGGYVNSLR
ncbi:MAG: DNA repair protein RecN [Gemmatimonadales bacterium]